MFITSYKVECLFKTPAHLFVLEPRVEMCVYRQQLGNPAHNLMAEILPHYLFS